MLFLPFFRKNKKTTESLDYLALHAIGGRCLLSVGNTFLFGDILLVNQWKIKGYQWTGELVFIVGFCAVLSSNLWSSSLAVKRLRFHDGL